MKLRLPRLGRLPLAASFTAFVSLAPALAQAQPVSYAVDAERSHVYAVTRRAGVLGFLGHDHAILATAWSARVCYASEEPTSSSASVTVSVPDLEIDSDQAAELAGLSSRPDDDTVADLQRRMLGPEFLDAEAHPEMRFESRTVREDEAADMTLLGPFHLHGEARAVRVPVEVSRPSEDTVRFRAEWSAKMSDYGIEPESNLGVVDVADEFDVFVDLVARPSSEPCS